MFFLFPKLSHIQPTTCHSPLKLLHPTKPPTPFLLLRCFASPPWMDEHNPTSTFSSSSSDSPLGFEGVVSTSPAKMRLDSWLALQLPHMSRARVQCSIRQGLAEVNGQPVHKASHIVRVGDHVKCTVSALLPLKAEPENLTLDIMYEDANVLVVNKPPHMVTHPAPGNLHGTLVNAILHHCELPLTPGLDQASCSNSNLDEVDENDDDDDLEEEEHTNLYATALSTHCVRPGIVHRLDKGTSGLLVVAKDAHSHGHLSDQFKSRKVKRSYISLTCGVPPSQAGRVDIAIGRDFHNRIRMTAVHNPNTSRRARTAARTEVYKWVSERVCSGRFMVTTIEGFLLIRVHAQHLGYPLLGDEVYGGTKGAALACLLRKLPSSAHDEVQLVISQLQRPCLHAHTLGFAHPQTGQELSFTCPVPIDFKNVWSQLQKLGSKNSNSNYL